MSSIDDCLHVFFINETKSYLILCVFFSTSKYQHNYYLFVCYTKQLEQVWHLIKEFHFLGVKDAYLCCLSPLRVNSFIQRVFMNICLLSDNRYLTGSVILFGRKSTPIKLHGRKITETETEMNKPCVCHSVSHAK